MENRYMQVYEEMQKQAAVEAIVEERLDVLSKYAEKAIELLNAENFEDGFNEADVVELSSKMIKHDLEVEKTAEAQTEVPAEPVAETAELDKVAEAIEYADFVASRVIERIKSELGN